MPPDKLFERCSPAVVRIVVRDKDHKDLGFGSGFLISEGGGLVTNYHVVDGATSASVIFANNPKVEIEVEGILATDKAGDLALLMIPGKNLPHLQLADGPPPKVGTKVYAIGNPEGMTNTLSDGLVSGLRSIPDPEAKPDIFDRLAATQPSVFHQIAAKRFAELTFLQTTAPISHGSSGGPLLTADGQVVGVTAGFLADAQNLNLAIPASRVAELFKKAGKMQPIASLGPKAPISSIWMAATFGDLNEVKANLAAGVDVNAKDKNGMTPLHWTAVTGDASTLAERKAQATVARFLLAHGADADAGSKTGRRPLHVAVGHFNLEVATVLADAGAALTARDDHGYTPLHEAAVSPGAVPLARLLLDRGVDANVRGQDGETPLHVATRNGNREMAKLLLDSGGNVDARETAFGWTPLHLAAYEGQVEMAQLLLDRGAKVDAVDKNGQTALHLAATKGQVEIARLLLKQLASVNPQDDGNVTPLHIAAIRGYVELTKVLLDNGAVVNAKDGDGRTPLDWALSPNAKPPAVAPADTPRVNPVTGNTPGPIRQSVNGTTPPPTYDWSHPGAGTPRISPATGLPMATTGRLPGGIMADLLRKYGGRTGSQ